MADRSHPEHEELRDWYGGDFEPDELSPETASRLLRTMVTGELPKDCDWNGSGCGRDNGARILWPQGPPARQARCPERLHFGRSITRTRPSGSHMNGRQSSTAMRAARG